MEGNASGSLTGSQNTSSQSPAPQTTIPQTERKKEIKWPFIVIGVLVMVAGIVVAYFLYSRRAGFSENQNQNNQDQGQIVSLEEYQNPDGFAFDYPSVFQLVPNDEGVRLAGETEISFVVKPMTEPLGNTVSEIADNFGIDQSTSDFLTKTINSRTGFVLTYEGKEYQYFPLYGEYYLEIVSDEGSETASEVLNTLEFTPPQASLN